MAPLPSVLALLAGQCVGDHAGHDGRRAIREIRATFYRHWHTDWHTNGRKSTTGPGN